MSRKVGRITLAAALMIAGVVVLIDNTLNTSFSWYAGRLWPVLLVGLGLEWVASATRSEREGSRTTADPGAIVGLIVVALIASSVSSWGRAPFRFENNVVENRPEFHIEVTPPTPPTVRTPVLPFGNVSADMVQTADLNLSQLQDLSVTTTSGDVTVQEGSRPMVEMRVRAYAGTAAAAEALARQVQLRVDASGSRTTVTGERPTSGARLEVSFIITLPREANVRLKVDSASGSVTVYDRNGDVTLSSNSGSIRAERVKGRVDVRATSGSVVVLNVEGDVAATSSSGSLQVEAITGSAKVGATSGSVILRDISGKVSAQSSSGGVNIDTGIIGGDWDINAVSGGVRMMMPASAGATVTARASSGRVTGPNWLTIGEGRNSGSGTLNDGAFKVNIRTSSGDIRLETR
ncbi:MAG TPA: DUF4097 family beta strand repeat-containing protein [Symbiobacteriaceae bacterium]|nr:DUF4097 family beta strand repeat-containing protein [Symbiobacteriaceae bacterium]